MSGFIVTVTFRIKPEHQAAFRRAILENAAASVEREPGCSVFDVCEGREGEIFLYEVYDDEPAFRAHLATDHFQRFDSQVASWVADKRISTYHRLDSAN